MDDLYTPITDMPGDSGQSSSASGMITNPLKKSRYAKNNDIIQKFAHSSPNKYINKSATFKKSNKIQKGSWDLWNLLRQGEEYLLPFLREFREEPIDAAKEIGKKVPSYRSKLTNPHETLMVTRGSLADLQDQAIAEVLPYAQNLINEGEQRGIRRGLSTQENAGLLARPPKGDWSDWFGNPIPDFRQLKSQFGALDELRKKPNIVWEKKRVFDTAFPTMYDDVVRDKFGRPVKNDAGEYVQSRPPKPGEVRRSVIERAYEDWNEKGRPSEYSLAPLETSRQPHEIFSDYASYDKAIEDFNQVYRNAAKAAANIKQTAKNTGKKIIGDLGLGLGAYGLGRLHQSEKDKSYYAGAQRAMDNLKQDKGWFDWFDSSDSQEAAPSKNDDDWGIPQSRVKSGGNFAMRATSMKKRNFYKTDASGVIKTVEDFLKWLRDDKLLEQALHSDPTIRIPAKQAIEDRLRTHGINPELITPVEMERTFPTWSLEGLSQSFPVSSNKRVTISANKANRTPRTRNAKTVWEFGGFKIEPPAWVDRLTKPDKQKAQQAMQGAKTKASAVGSKVKNFVSNPWVAAGLGSASTIGLGAIGANALLSENNSQPVSKKPTSYSIPDLTPTPSMVTGNIDTANENQKPKATPNAYDRLKAAPITATAISEKIRQNAENTIKTKVAPKLKEKMENALTDISAIYEHNNPYINNIVRGSISDSGGMWGTWNKYGPGGWYYKPVNKRAGVNKRSKSMKKGYIDSQSFGNSATAYVNPTTKARFSMMSPEAQGEALVNQFAENTKQNFKNTKSFLTDVITNAVQDAAVTGNYAARFAGGALNAADKQTNFSRDILPQLQVGANIAGKKILSAGNKTAAISQIGAQFVISAAKEAAQNMPEISIPVSKQSLKNNLNQIIEKTPTAINRLYDIGKKVLSQAESITPGIKAQYFDSLGIKNTKNQNGITKRQTPMTFTKRLENPKSTNSHQTKNKYFTE